MSNDTHKLVGYYLWATFGHGYPFRNKLYSTREDAVEGLAGIVWHNRSNFAVRAVYIGTAPTTEARDA